METLEVGKSTSKSKTLKKNEEKKRIAQQGSTMCGSKNEKACCMLF
jgi:hypothetical protein